MTYHDPIAAFLLLVVHLAAFPLIVGGVEAIHRARSRRRALHTIKARAAGFDEGFNR